MKIDLKPLLEIAGLFAYVSFHWPVDLLVPISASYITIYCFITAKKFARSSLNCAYTCLRLHVQIWLKDVMADNSFKTKS